MRLNNGLRTPLFNPHLQKPTIPRGVPTNIGEMQPSTHSWSSWSLDEVEIGEE